MSFNFKSILAATAIAASLSGCDETTASVSDGYDRNVLIVNQTGQTIYRFYGSNVGTSSWEEDILGSSVLPSGQSVMINFDDGSGYCNFDFKIEFQDGSYITESNINVCVVGTYTVN
jgi:hypothetical protein